MSFQPLAGKARRRFTGTMRAFRCRPGRWPRTRTRPRAGTHPGAAGASGRIPETRSRSARTDRARTARPMHHPRIHGTVRPRGRRCRSEPRSRTGASKVRRRSRPRRRRMRHRLVNHPGLVIPAVKPIVIHRAARKQGDRERCRGLKKSSAFHGADP